MRKEKRRDCLKNHKNCLKWTLDPNLIDTKNKRFGKYSWHGIWLKTDEDGNLLIKLSTNNKTLVF
jgi:hypothetical protein